MSRISYSLPFRLLKQTQEARVNATIKGLQSGLTPLVLQLESKERNTLRAGHLQQRRGDSRLTSYNAKRETILHRNVQNHPVDKMQPQRYLE